MNYGELQRVGNNPNEDVDTTLFKDVATPTTITESSGYGMPGSHNPSKSTIEPARTNISGGGGISVPRGELFNGYGLPNDAKLALRSDFENTISTMGKEDALNTLKTKYNMNDSTASQVLNEFNQERMERLLDQTNNPTKILNQVKSAFESGEIDEDRYNAVVSSLSETVRDRAERLNPKNTLSAQSLDNVNVLTTYNEEFAARYGNQDSKAPSRTIAGKYTDAKRIVAYADSKHNGFISRMLSDQEEEELKTEDLKIMESTVRSLRELGYDASLENGKYMIDGEEVKPGIMSYVKNTAPEMVGYIAGTAALGLFAPVGALGGVALFGARVGAGAVGSAGGSLISDLGWREQRDIDISTNKMYRDAIQSGVYSAMFDVGLSLAAKGVLKTPIVKWIPKVNRHVYGEYIDSISKPDSPSPAITIRTQLQQDEISTDAAYLAFEKDAYDFLGESKGYATALQEHTGSSTHGSVLGTEGVRRVTAGIIASKLMDGAPISKESVAKNLLLMNDDGGARIHALYGRHRFQTWSRRKVKIKGEVFDVQGATNKMSAELLTVLSDNSNKVGASRALLNKVDSASYEVKNEVPNLLTKVTKGAPRTEDTYNSALVSGYENKVADLTTKRTEVIKHIEEINHNQRIVPIERKIADVDREIDQVVPEGVMGRSPVVRTQLNRLKKNEALIQSANDELSEIDKYLGVDDRGRFADIERNWEDLNMKIDTERGAKSQTALAQYEVDTTGARLIGSHELGSTWRDQSVMAGVDFRKAKIRKARSLTNKIAKLEASNEEINKKILGSIGDTVASKRKALTVKKLRLEDQLRRTPKDAEEIVATSVSSGEIGNADYRRLVTSTRKELARLDDEIMLNNAISGKLAVEATEDATTKGIQLKNVLAEYSGKTSRAYSYDEAAKMTAVKQDLILPYNISSSVAKPSINALQDQVNLASELMHRTALTAEGKELMEGVVDNVGVLRDEYVIGDVGATGVDRLISLVFDTENIVHEVKGLAVAKGLSFDAMVKPLDDFIDTTVKYISGVVDSASSASPKLKKEIQNILGYSDFSNYWKDINGAIRDSISLKNNEVVSKWLISNKRYSVDELTTVHTALIDIATSRDVQAWSKSGRGMSSLNAEVFDTLESEIIQTSRDAISEQLVMAPESAAKVMRDGLTALIDNGKSFISPAGKAEIFKAKAVLHPVENLYSISKEMNKLEDPYTGSSSLSVELASKVMFYIVGSVWNVGRKVLSGKHNAESAVVRSLNAMIADPTTASNIRALTDELGGVVELAEVAQLAKMSTDLYNGNKLIKGILSEQGMDQYIDGSVGYGTHLGKSSRYDTPRNKAENDMFKGYITNTDSRLSGQHKVMSNNKMRVGKEVNEQLRDITSQGSISEKQLASIVLSSPDDMMDSQVFDVLADEYAKEAGVTARKAKEYIYRNLKVRGIKGLIINNRHVAPNAQLLGAEMDDDDGVRTIIKF